MPRACEALPDNKVRCVLGDCNMACYRIVPELSKVGIEACLLDYHVEWPCDDGEGKLFYDSCGIIVVGGLKQKPKALLSSSHLVMGAMTARHSKSDCRGDESTC